MASTGDPTNENRLPESSVYPKTSGKIQDVIFNLNRISVDFDPNHRDGFKFTGTVKLHGTHADIVFHPGDLIKYQSRNCQLTAASDNHGFAAFCDARRAALLGIRRAIVSIWNSNSLNQPPLGEDDIITVAGEWIGAGIQKNMAISKLSKRFVIFGINFCGLWHGIEQFQSISDEDAMIFNVCRGGLYHEGLSVSDGGVSFLREAEKHTMAVIASCPFGKTFGVDGPGEGIVWTITIPESRGMFSKPEFWLKTKLETFREPEIQVDSSKQSADEERRARAKKFAETVCTEARMAQAWDFLRELGKQRSKGQIGVFLSWLWNDIEVEEKAELEALGIGSAYKTEGAKIAKNWYFSQPLNDKASKSAE